MSKTDLNRFAAGARGTINALWLGKSDGLLNPEANGGNWPAGVAARDGRLWFPTQDGVAVIDPASVEASDTPVPALIESFQVDRTSMPFDDGLRLTARQNTFEIRYTGLSFNKSAWLRFRYRLTGLDEEWVEAGRRRTAYYSHVPPGKYTFTVIAASGDGVWNTHGDSLSIVVVPRFWQTPWFWSLLALAGIGATAAAYRRRIAGLNRARAAQQAFAQQLIDSQERDRGRIAAELHDSLGQQLLIIKNRALLGTMAEPHADEAKEQFDEISTTATRSLDEIRAIARDLRPYHLDRLGLTCSIEDMVERISTSSEIRVSSRHQSGLVDTPACAPPARRVAHQPDAGDRRSHGNRGESPGAHCRAQDHQGDRHRLVRQPPHRRSPPREHRREAGAARQPCFYALRHRAPVCAQ